MLEESLALPFEIAAGPGIDIHGHVDARLLIKLAQVDSVLVELFYVWPFKWSFYISLVIGLFRQSIVFIFNLVIISISLVKIDLIRLLALLFLLNIACLIVVLGRLIFDVVISTIDGRRPIRKRVLTFTPVAVAILRKWVIARVRVGRREVLPVAHHLSRLNIEKLLKVENLSKVTLDFCDWFLALELQF